MEMVDRIIFNSYAIPTLEPKFTKGCKFKADLTKFFTCDIDIYGDINKGEYSLIQNPIITHSGTFHADEIFSIALIMLTRISYINKKLEDMGYKYSVKFGKHHLINTVYRVPNIESIDNDVYENDNSIVIDLIGGHYDHHHANSNDKPTTKDLDFFELFENVEPVATFGALWNAIGYLYDIDNPYLKMNCREKIYRDFIQPIDIVDCNGPRYAKSPVSRIISNLGDYGAYEHNFVAYVPVKKNVKQNMTFLQSNFIEAVMLAYKILRDEIIRQQKVLSSVSDVYKYCSFDTVPIMNDDGETFGKINVCSMNKLEDENDMVSINIETLDYVKVKDIDESVETDIPEIFINHNPNMRDKSYRFIVRDSTFIKLSNDIIKGNDVPGKVFAHPSGFMIIFDTDNHLNDFMKNIYITFECREYSDKDCMIICYKKEEANE